MQNERKSAHPFVHFCEFVVSFFLIDDLRHSNQLAFVVEDRFAQHAVGDVASLLIHLLIEPRVLKAKKQAWRERIQNERSTALRLNPAPE